MIWAVILPNVMLIMVTEYTLIHPALQSRGVMLSMFYGHIQIVHLGASVYKACRLVKTVWNFKLNLVRMISIEYRPCYIHDFEYIR